MLLTTLDVYGCPMFWILLCPNIPPYSCLLQISQLVEDVQRLQSSIGKLQETSASQIARLEEDLDLKRQHILRLEARLEAQRDYEELKRQLRLVRDDSSPSEEPNSILANNQTSQIENSSSTDDLSPHKDMSHNVTSDSTGKFS